MKDDLPVDRRIIRTNYAIRRALVELINEKGLDALTIKDIVSRADINRGTFYLHYKDKYDLLEQIEMEVIHEMEAIISKANALNLTDIKSENPFPLLIELFQYIQQNAPLMHVILQLKGKFDFQAQVRKTVERNLKIGFLTIMKTAVPLVPEEYLITYVLSAHLGVVKAWLHGGCVESPYEMAHILSRLSIDGPFHAISFPDMK